MLTPNHVLRTGQRRSCWGRFRIRKFLHDLVGLNPTLSSLLKMPTGNPYGHEVPWEKVGAGMILTDIIFVPQPSLPDATH